MNVNFRSNAGIMRMILIGMLCAACLFPSWHAPSYVDAETGTVIIAADTSVQVGDKMNVTVKYSASSLGSIEGELRYDPDMLKYVSGGTASNPSGGVIKLNKEMAGETSQIFNIRFEVVGPGSDFFLVNTFELTDSEGKDLGKPGASVKLVSYEKAAAPDKEQPDDSVVAPDDPTDNPATDTPDADQEPASEEPAVDVDSDTDVADEGSNEKAPDTVWVFVGAIAATTGLLVLSLVIVNRRRKTE